MLFAARARPFSCPISQQSCLLSGLMVWEQTHLAGSQRGIQIGQQLGKMVRGREVTNAPRRGSQLRLPALLPGWRKHAADRAVSHLRTVFPNMQPLVELKVRQRGAPMEQCSLFLVCHCMLCFGLPHLQSDNDIHDVAKTLFEAPGLAEAWRLAPRCK